jgi:hypothetical protein
MELENVDHVKRISGWHRQSEKEVNELLASGWRLLAVAKEFDVESGTTVYTLGISHDDFLKYQHDHPASENPFGF